MQEELLRLAKACDLDGVQAFFQGMPEVDRVALSQPALSMMQDLLRAKPRRKERWGRLICAILWETLSVEQLAGVPFWLRPDLTQLEDLSARPALKAAWAAALSRARTIEDPQAKLQALMEAGDVEGVLQLFSGMSERARRAFYKPAAAQLTAVERHSYPPDPLAQAAMHAVWATASVRELSALPSYYRPERAENMPGRSQAVITAWAKRLNPEDGWGFTQQLVREGRIPRPDDADYTIGMIAALACWRSEDAGVLAQLERYPELLEGPDAPVWQIFKVEGQRRDSLTSWDQVAGEGGWKNALLELSSQGRLPRARLLSESLAALSLGFSDYNARWYMQLFDALKPTQSELSERAEAVLSLMDSGSEAALGWGLKKLRNLDNLGCFRPEELRGAIGPALLSTKKTTARAALSMCAQLCKKDPQNMQDTLRAATAALGHPAADVQEQALSLLERYPEVALEDLGFEIAPTLQSRFTARFKLEAEAPEAPAVMPQLGDLPAPLAELFQIPALLSPPEPWSLPAGLVPPLALPLPRLKVEQRIEPIEDWPTLIELCAEVFEGQGGVEAFERALCGLSRLCADPPAELLAPLWARARKLAYPPFRGREPSQDLAAVVLALDPSASLAGVRRGQALEDEPLDWAEESPYAGMFQPPAERVRRIGVRVAAGQAGPLYSTPTHSGMWIEPSALVERVRARPPEATDHLDLQVALLRLAPEGRAAALERVPEGAQEGLSALRYAFGARTSPIEDRPLWRAAVWSRDPTRAAKAAKVRLHHRPAQDSFPMLLSLIGHAFGGDAELISSFWPAGRQQHFAAALENYEWDSLNAGLAWMRPLLEPGSPLGRPGATLIARGLAAKQPELSGLATDAAILAIEDGRLGSDNLGEGLLAALPAVTPSRWPRPLAEVAQASAAHAAVVKLALESLVAPAKESPRQLGGAIELLLQLSVQLRTGPSEAAQAALAGIEGRSKLAKAAQALCALARDPAEERALSWQLAELRIAAASRWL